MPSTRRRFFRWFGPAAKFREHEIEAAPPHVYNTWPTSTV